MGVRLLLRNSDGTTQTEDRDADVIPAAIEPTPDQLSLSDNVVWLPDASGVFSARGTAEELSAFHQINPLTYYLSTIAERCQDGVVWRWAMPSGQTVISAEPY